MWVLDMFPGDDNECLKDIQHGNYEHVQRMLIATAKTAIFEYHDKRGAGIDTFLLTEMRDLKTFDHRTLQLAHDLIAASFRKLAPRREVLPFRDETSECEGFEASAWFDYATREARSLCKDISIAKAFCVAILEGSGDDRRRAELDLAQALGSRYS